MPVSRATPSTPRAKLPADVDPWAIANDPKLDRAAKLARLHQLEQDVRLVAVAQEEGMTGTTRLPALQDVLEALEHVAGPDSKSDPETSGAASSTAAKI